jgi:protein phosphatase
MGTTLTAAWLQGRTVTVANLGDSRAYLVRGGRAEQLTVDDDVGSALVLGGVPPEEVRQAGGVAEALRNCVGGCARDEAGRPFIHEEFCRPALSEWPLLPGDVLVLCTDGLVDEGTFLEPADLAAIVTEGIGLSAEELALRLADAADARQRLPSTEEPGGCGDNIGCVVVKIGAAG